MSYQNNNSEPPKWAIKLLSWFCDESLIEAIEGDLWEAFQADLGQHSAKRAQLKFIINTVKFLKPQYMQQSKGSLGLLSKISNYIKISFRNFKRHKLVSTINLVGMGLGLAVSILSWQYLQHHLTSDTYMPDSNRIYRVIKNYRSQSYSTVNFPNY